MITQPSGYKPFYTSLHTSRPTMAHSSHTHILWNIPHFSCIQKQSLTVIKLNSICYVDCWVKRKIMAIVFIGPWQLLRRVNGKVYFLFRICCTLDNWGSIVTSDSITINQRTPHVGFLTQLKGGRLTWKWQLPWLCNTLEIAYMSKKKVKKWSRFCTQTNFVH